MRLRDVVLETEVRLGGGSRAFSGLVFWLTRDRGGGGGGGRSPLYGSQFVFAIGTLVHSEYQQAV